MRGCVIAMLVQQVLAAGVLGLAATAAGQPAGTPDVSAFTVEWRRTTEPWRRPTLEGYVNNHSQYRVGNVRLRIEALDGTDRVVGESFAWVYGNIPAGSRWYFSVPVPRAGAATFRISVVSFTLMALESP